ncbi:hypothetical protein IJT17_03125 [bacterium]|nr:hypothetical protein [bacterium]
MYNSSAPLDFASLSQLAPEDALRQAFDYCEALRTENDELKSALAESMCVLQSLVRDTLQREGRLLAQPCDPSMTLGDFLNSLRPSAPASASQTAPSQDSPALQPAISEQPADTEPETETAASQAETSEPQAPQTSEPQKAAASEKDTEAAEQAASATPEGAPQEADAKPAEADKAAVPAAAQQEADAKPEEAAQTSEPHNADASDKNTKTAKQAEQTTSAAPEAAPQEADAKPAETDKAAAPAAAQKEAAPHTDKDSKTELQYANPYKHSWPDSPLASAEASFGGLRARQQRDQLVAWMRDSRQTLSPKLFTTAQRQLLTSLMMGSDNLTEIASRQDTSPKAIGSIREQISAHSAIWKNFYSYAQQLLHEWSMSMELEPDEPSMADSYLGSTPTQTAYKATLQVQEDGDISQAVSALASDLYGIANIELVGCESGSPMSAYAEDSCSLLMHKDWCGMRSSEKLCLVNWQLNSIAHRQSKLRRTLQTILSLEETPEDLGCTLVKRTSSVAMSRSKCSDIPSELMMEISGIWGSEQLDELDDLLERIYEATHYAPFLYARELIATPHPLLQLFDLSADMVSLRLTNIVSATRAAIAQVYGVKAIPAQPNKGLAKLLHNPGPYLGYLQRRVAGIWAAYCAGGKQ